MGGGGGLQGGHPGLGIMNPCDWIPNGIGGGDLKIKMANSIVYRSHLI